MNAQVGQLSFENCIKCTVCTVYCPVAKTNPLYPGPKQCGPDGERLRIKSPDYYDEALSMCTNCKRCETACPSGVRIGDLIANAKGSLGKKTLSPKTVRDYVLSHTDLFGSLATPMGHVVNKMTQLIPVKTILDKTLGVDHHKSLPKYAQGTFRAWFKKHKLSQAKFSRHVSYFHGCYVNYNHPQLGKDVVAVLNAMNYGVTLLDKEKCCGVPLIANGFLDKARKNARLNVEQMTAALHGSSHGVISTSSSCCLALKEEYPHVLGVENDAIVNDVHFFSRFLLRAFEQGEGPTLKPLNKVVVYHTPCHLERSGEHLFTIELLKRIPGLTVIVLDSQCCGLAGTYGFKSENYATSMAIGAPLFAAMEESGADYAITDCEACKWQIEENTSLACHHPMTLLAMALESQSPYPSN